MKEVTPTPGVTSARRAADSYGRHMATGSLLMGMVRVGVIPLGLLAAVVLARALGPGDLGVFAVASSLVWWAQATLNAFFNRTTVKLVAEATDWQPLATALVQLQFLGGIATAALVFLAAAPLGALFDAPALAGALRMFAFAVPAYSLTRGHESVLVARREFRRSAFFPLFYNTSRSLLLLLLVGLGGGLTGAIVAQLAAALVELAYARAALALALFRRVSFPVRRIARYSAPMFVDGFGRQLNPRIDLWSVQALAGSTPAGYYSAAQSALSPLGAISQILSPLLLATLTHALHQGQGEAARSIARHVLRLLFCLLPFIALAVGASRELIALVFGSAFQEAAPLFAWLCLGMFASFVLSFTTVTLAALDRPGVIAVFTLPMLVASAAGSLLLVPQIGAVGAALTTALTQWGAMVASLWLLPRRSGIALDLATMLRVVPPTILAFAAASVWHVPGLWVILELLVLSAVVLAVLFALALVTRDDLTFLVSLVRRSAVPGTPQGQTRPES